jgi:hypothetical protein
LLASFLTTSIDTAQGQVAETNKSAGEMSEFSDEELEAYVRADERVNRLMSASLKTLSDAEPEKRAVINSQVNRQMLQIVESEGLSVARFNAIFDAARKNPYLASKLEALR